MAVKRMPPRYGSSVLSTVRYALPPSREKNGNIIAENNVIDADLEDV
jgi:hypothetical protein